MTQAELESFCNFFSFRSGDEGFADDHEIGENGDRPLLFFQNCSSIFYLDLDLTVNHGEPGRFIIFKKEGTFFPRLPVKTLHAIRRHLHLFAENSNLTVKGFLKEESFLDRT